MLKRPKIAIVGAGGNVGAAVAHWAAIKELGDLVLIDLKGSVAQGRGLDLTQCSAFEGFNNASFVAGEDPALMKDADVIVMTAGVPRKPGQSREELININAGIVRDICANVKKYAPESILIVVSNPLDAMVQRALQVTGFDPCRVVGQAGILDTARYRAFLAEALNISPKDIQAMILGGHGDTMVPLPRYTTVAGIPVTELIGPAELNAIIERTKVGGGELVKLMGTSAWYAPGSAAAQMVEAIVKNQRRIFPVCIKLEGEYGIDNCYLGVPAILGKNGIERVIELNLNQDEKALLETSRKHVKEVMEVLEKIGS